MMFEHFFPDAHISSVYRVDYNALYQFGYRAVGYDIDNTLVPHDAPATKKVIRLFKRIRGAGLKTFLISNNDDARVKPFANAIKADLYLCNSHKPEPNAFYDAANYFHLSRKQLIFFGDQLFTDIWGAKNAGVTSVLVKPVWKEKLFRIKVKRFLERPILKLYFHKNGKMYSDDKADNTGTNQRFLKRIAKTIPAERTKKLNIR